MKDFIEKAREYALKCHRGTNHLYDGKPYEVHLQMVVDVAKEYIDLIPDMEQTNIIAACWLHDVIEDCRQTYNDVLKNTNIPVAEIVYALTNEKGKNRKQRANNQYYKGIRDTPFADFVKLCDRIANIKYSSQSGSSMLNAYRNEYLDFMQGLQPNPEYWRMIQKMQELLSLTHAPTSQD